MGSKPPLILSIDKPSPTISTSTLFLSGLAPVPPLQMTPRLGDGAFGEGIAGIKRRSRWPSFFPF